MRIATKDEIERYLVECASCGKKHIPIITVGTVNNYCKACKSKLAIDFKTKEQFPKKEMTYFRIQDIYLKSPHPDHIKKSFISNKKIYTDNSILPEDKKCGMSSSGDWALCSELKENDYVNTGKKWVIRTSIIQYGNLYFDKNTFARDIENMSSVILNYSTKPTPIFRKEFELEHKGIGVPYLGIELEVTDPTNTMQKEDLARKVIKLMMNLDLVEYFYMKSDSSIGNGVEIVSHPTTASHFKTRKIKEFLDGLNEIGLQADDRCGYHIHVSRNSLSKKSWWSMMTLITKLTNKFIKISRRDKTKMSYCKFEGMRGGLLDALLKGKEIFNQDVLKNNDDRSRAINLMNDKTVEFRLFKSTTDHVEFIGTIELIDSLVNFCREYSFMYIQDERSSDLWISFVEFSRRKNYSYLIKMLSKMDLVTNNYKK